MTDLGYVSPRCDRDSKAWDLSPETVDPKPQQTTPAADPVNHPAHYNGHPSGVECIQIAEHMGFNLGNALKYIWRADLKGNAIEDLNKAAWYVQREIERRERNGYT